MLGGNLDIAFFALAAVFGVLAWRERKKTGGKPSPRGRTWLRIAVIFFLVSLYLFWTLRLSGF